jgi:hypothetical protein
MGMMQLIEERIIQGMVLNEHGKWVTIAEKSSKERNLLNHLEAGEVLANGKWVSIDNAKKNPNIHATAMSSIAVTDETRLSDEEKRSDYYPPETLLLVENTQNIKTDYRHDVTHDDNVTDTTTKQSYKLNNNIDIFDETIAFSPSKLRRMTEEEKTRISHSYAEIKNNDSGEDSWEKAKKREKKVLFYTITIICVAGIAAGVIFSLI